MKKIFVLVLAAAFLALSFGVCAAKASADDKLLVNIEENAEFLASMVPTLIVSAVGLIVLKIAMIIGFLALAILIVSFMTKHVGVISGRIEKYWWKALLWGMAGIVLTPFITLFLLVTIVGIPLILVQAVLLSAAFILGFMAVAQIVGKKVLKAFKTYNQPMIVEVILGLVVLFLVELIPVVGGIVKVVAATIGLGGAITSKFGLEK